MDGLYLHGLGHFHPENVIDNAFLESLDIGTNDAWILERVGIRTRRTVLDLDYLRRTQNADPRAAQEASRYTNAETGKRAAMMALERAKLRPSDIGMVIAGGCSPEFAIPAEACRIAAALEIEAPAFDVNSACSSFGAHAHLLASMRTPPPFVLLVQPENNTRVIDYRDRSSAVLWGDGTSAAVVSAEHAARIRIRGTSLASSPAGWEAVQIPPHQHFRQDGPTVQRFAIRTSVDALTGLLPDARALAKERGGRLLFVGHQANLLMLEAVRRRLEVSAEHHLHNVERLGNTGASGAPSVVSERWDELKDGDVILLAVVGSGLTWSRMFMEVGAA